MSFPLIAPPVLSRSAVLRDEPLRLDADRQLRDWPSARLVVVDDKGRTPVDWGAGGPPEGPWDTVAEDSARLRTRPTSGHAPPPDAVLLGEADGVAYWAVRREAGEDQGEWADLRTAGAALDALGAGLLTGAVAVLNWHDAARFCGRDGSPMHPGNAGWHRVCEAHGHEDYPRTDPAIICLVHDGADQVLLARQPTWPEGRYSVLAGFVEAGESLEACVLREIHEEVGAHVRDVRYLGSQAWPFPRSLMVGFSAVADPEVPLVPADGEIAEAMWVSRAELRRALEAGDWGASPQGERPLLLPGRVSIARSMLESWAAL
ncbi:NAD(+) diphosphatase [Pseudonocardia kunmingensis]|uniref:NAD(+) diphosphatase n=1 Tax=Pseudonocardia kunmingensis TaxID=630975 RepID=A0A543CYP2_9PSEU|nr:NAD(+) diphosphatase [Pseudonocardia kunmingensis]TQM02223.1 NAD+ diphosphatase [Pseudonocardia kunmingensis]